MHLQKVLTDLIDKLQGWVHNLLLLLPNIVVAILLLLIFWFIARILDRILRNILTRFSVGDEIIDLSAVTLFSIVILAGMFVGLSVLGLNKTVTSLLAGIGILGVVLGLAFQSTGENYVAGIYLSISRPFQIGQIIKSIDFYGVVERITLRSTWLRVPDGQLVYLPNKKIFDNPIINFSDSGKRRVDIDARMAYTADLKQARQIAIDAVTVMQDRDLSRDVELFYREFEASWIEFQLRFWIDFRSQTNYLAARSEAIMRIKAAFDEQGIAMPFPIRTLDLTRISDDVLENPLRANRSGQDD